MVAKVLLSWLGSCCCGNVISLVDDVIVQEMLFESCIPICCKNVFVVAEAFLADQKVNEKTSLTKLL